MRKRAAAILVALVTLNALPLPAAVTVVLSETFGVRSATLANDCDPNFPAGWTLYDVDGLPRHANIAGQVDGAWATYADMAFNAGNCVALSTSWYDPPGQADDWMVTPLITIPALNPELRFVAVVHDPAFPDGYEVRWATTNSVAAFLANAPLLTIAAENPTKTLRVVDLDALAGP
jgi:hypothetical protein